MNPAFTRVSTDMAEFHAVAARTPRTRVADRVAQRVGLWLLVWSSHPPAAAPTRAAQVPVRTVARRAPSGTPWAEVAHAQAELHRTTFMHDLPHRRI